MSGAKQSGPAALKAGHPIADVRLGDAVSSGLLAEILGVSPEQVRQLVHKGAIESAPGGGYHVATAIRSVYQRQASMLHGRGGTDELADLSKERAMLAREQRRGHELKNAEKARELLPAADVERAWGDVATIVRNRILGLVNDFSQAFPHLTRAELDLMDRLTRDALEEAHAGIVGDAGEG